MNQLCKELRGCEGEGGTVPLGFGEKEGARSLSLVARCHFILHNFSLQLPAAFHETTSTSVLPEMGSPALTRILVSPFCTSRTFSKLMQLINVAKDLSSILARKLVVPFLAKSAYRGVKQVQ